MNIKRTFPIALAALLTVGCPAARPSLPTRDEDREATALQGAKVTLVQAIGTAERQTGGQAYDAGVDVKGGKTRISVETNGPRGSRRSSSTPRPARSSPPTRAASQTRPRRRSGPTDDGGGTE